MGGQQVGEQIHVFSVQIGKTAVRIFRPGIENRLRGLFDFGFLRFGGFRPWEVIVDDVFGIALITFQTSCYRAHPCHMDVGGENTKMIESCVGDDFYKITTKDIWCHKSNWNITPTL